MRKNLDVILTLGVILFIGAMGLSSPRPASAWTDVSVAVSTAMVSMVSVSTAATGLGAVGTGKGATRVDNWNNGSQGATSQTLLSGRVSVCLQNVSTFTATAYCGWSVNTSTQATTALPQVGWTLAKDEYLCVGALRGLAFYCNAQDAAGVTGATVSVWQLGRNE